MVSGDRHPKQPVEQALQLAERAGFTVRRVHNKGHRWGELLCTCGASMSIYSTPRNPDNFAKAITRFQRRHEHT